MDDFKEENVRQNLFFILLQLHLLTFRFQITYNMNWIEYYFISLVGTLRSKFQLFQWGYPLFFMASTFLIVSH
jgi:hypothetical protein